MYSADHSSPKKLDNFFEALKTPQLNPVDKDLLVTYSRLRGYAKDSLKLNKAPGIDDLMVAFKTLALNR